MSGDGVRRTTYAGNATVVTNQPAPVQQTAAEVQYVGGAAWPLASDEAVATAANDGKMPAGAYRKLAYQMHVSDFSIASLTPSNFEDAVLAAIAYAYSIPVVGDTHVGVTLDVPPGDWNQNARTWQVKARDNYGIALKFRGHGSGVCRLTWPSLPVGGTYSGAGVCIWLDGSHALNHPFHRGGIEGLTIICNHSAATGIYFEQLLKTRFDDVTVRASAGVAAVSGQTGTQATLGAPDALGQQTVGGLANMTEDSVARVLTLAGAASGGNAGTFLIMRYLGPGSVVIYNPGGSADANSGSITWTEKFRGSGLRTRGDYTNSRGLAVTNSQNVRLDHMSVEQVGCSYWLESCTEFLFTHAMSDQASAGGGGVPANDIVIGHNVEMAWMGGMTQSILPYPVFELPGKVGGKTILIDGCYQEGANIAFAKLHPPVSGTTHYRFRRIGVANSQTAIDANGTTTLKFEAPQGSPAAKWLIARECGDIQFEISDNKLPLSNPGWWDLDACSRQVAEVRGAGKRYRGAAPAHASLIGLLWEKAAEIFDARCGVQLDSSGLVQQWTGLKGTVFAAPSAGQRPIYMRRVRQLGGMPAIGTRTNGNRTMSGSLATPIPVGSALSMIVVAAQPANSNYHYGSSRGPCMFDATGANQFSVGIDDGTTADGFTQGKWVVPGLGTLTSGSMAIPATKRIMLFAGQYHPDGQGQLDYFIHAEGSASNGSNAPGTALRTTAPITTVQLNGVYGTLTGSELDQALIVYLHTMLTLDELQYLYAHLQQAFACDAPTAPVGPLVTSSPPGGTVDQSINDVVIPVSLTAASVTINLSAQHRRGDRVTFVVTTAASGHSLTVSGNGSTISGASTLVLSADYASAALISDGSNWFRL